MTKLRLGMFLCAIALFAGCATLPEFRDEPVTTSEIVRHVRCELRASIRSDSRYRWLLTQYGKGWNTRLGFTLEVNHTGDVSTGDNVWNFPLSAGGAFNLSLNAVFRGTGNRKENIEFDQRLAKLDSDDSLDCPGAGGRHARLGGHLGIGDLLERATLTRADAYNDFTKLTYDLEFVIVRSANLSPRFNVIPVGRDNTFTGIIKWSGANTDTQKLSLTLTPPAQDKESVCPVVPDPDDPEGWADPKACPTPVYEVRAKAACAFLPNRAACASRTDCKLIAAQDGKKETCAAVCDKLGKAQCNGRSDCRWTADSSSCTTVAGAGSRLRSGVVPTYVPRPAPTTSPQLSPADRDALDRASSRNLLEGIESELRRQRIGN